MDAKQWHTAADSRRPGFACHFIALSHAAAASVCTQIACDACHSMVYCHKQHLHIQQRV